MDLDEFRSLLSSRQDMGWRVDGLEAVSITPGRVVARVEVTAGLTNMAGTLHGGAAATLVDNVGTMAIASVDRDRRWGVSTDLNVTWFAPSPLGEHVLVEATVLKSGRSLAFVTVDLRRESDGVLSAQGRMTKSLGPPPSAPVN